MKRFPFVLIASLAASAFAGGSADKSQFTLFNPTPDNLRRAYNADRPSKTDSPFTIDAGVFQVEADVANWTLDNEDAVRTRVWILGNTNFKLGLTNGMDLQIFPQLYVDGRISGPAFGRPAREEGFGDTTVRLKFNLLGNDSGKFVLGFVASVKAPTNTVDFLNDEWEPGFGLPFNYTLPGGFILFGQTRIDVLDDPLNGGPRVQWQNPIGLSRTIVGNLSGYLEFYNAASTRDGYPWLGTLDVGVICQLTPNCSIDINSFFGVTKSAPDYNVFLGFARRF